MTGGPTGWRRCRGWAEHRASCGSRLAALCLLLNSQLQAGVSLQLVLAGAAGA